MRAALLFFLAVCVVATLGQRTAVDLWWNSATAGSEAGNLALPPLTLGLNGAVAFEIQFMFPQEPTGRNSLIAVGNRGTNADDIEVFFTGKRLNVRLGTEIVTSAADISTSNANGRLWNYLAVSISNDLNSGLASVQVWVNGVDFTSTLSRNTFANTGLSSNKRQYNFLGYSTFGGSISNFKGLVDSFHVWGQVLSRETITAHALLQGADQPYEVDGLIARWMFDETSGKRAVGVGGRGSADGGFTAVLDFPRATFSGGAFVGWQFCQGWGDPHFNTPQASYDTIHVEGYFNMVACEDPNGSNLPWVFSINSWHVQGAYWGTNTVGRALNMRMGLSMFQFNGQQALAHNLGPAAYTYKELQVGQSPDDVAWTVFTPQIGVPVVLSSGLTLELLGANDYFRITGAPYGYADWIDQGGLWTYLNMYINGASCYRASGSGAGVTVCNGYQQPAGSWVFNQPPGAPLTPFAPLAPVISPPPAPTCVAPFLDIAERVCAKCHPNEVQTNGFNYEACIRDVCFTGEPTCKVPECVVGEPCCRCAVTATECIIHADNSTSCACQAGYGGPDCSQIVNMVAIELSTATTLYDSKTYTLSGYDMADALPITTVPTDAEIARANPWNVKNSLLVYVGTSKRVQNDGSILKSQHLYVVHDASSSVTGLSHTLSMGYTGSFGSQNAIAIGRGASVPASATPGSVAFATMPTSNAGFVLRDLPASWCVTFTTDGNFGDNQVVVGSGNIRGQLELLRVVESGSSFEVCGRAFSNPCLAHLDCGSCTADLECGWCRTTGTCRYGRAAGPTDGTTCPAWAFTFTDTTRRITQMYGYPVSPVDTTVVMAQIDGANKDVSLPIEIKVDMAYRFASAWDVNVVFPHAANNAADLAKFKASMDTITGMMSALYLNSALSVGVYGARATETSPAESNGDAGVYQQVFPLAAPGGASGAAMSTLVSQVGILGATASTRVFLSEALVRAAATQHPNWRQGSRHTVIIFVKDQDVFHATATPTTSYTHITDALVSFSVLPIFVADASVKQHYVDYAAKIKMGIVIDYNADSIAQAIDRALTDASGAVSVVENSEHTGHLDTSAGKLDDTNRPTLTITGMNGQMKARAVVPVTPSIGNNGYTELLVPGFGASVIEYIDSDNPYTNARDITIYVDQPLDPWTTASETLVYLSGSPADVLQSNAPVVAHIKDLTGEGGRVNGGKVFQFDEDRLRSGSPLVEIVLNGASYVTVTDVQGRVVYQPPSNEFGNSNEDVFARIVYKVSDECSDSVDGEAKIFVKYDNNENPLTSSVARNTDENKAVVLAFVGTDTREHELTLVIVKAPVNKAGTAAELSGNLYAWSAACEAAVSANFRDVAACGAALVDGSTVAPQGTHTDGADNTWTTTTKVVYVPHEYANSQGVPAVYRTQPVLAYKFTQVLNDLDINGGFAALSTSEVSVEIVIAPVNQAPQVAIRDAQGHLPTWLSFPSTYVDIDASACSSGIASCEYDQNLGVTYPNLPAPAQLYFSAADLDSSSLSVRITGYTCAAGSRVETLGGEQIAVGTVLTQTFASNGWGHYARFMPAQDGSGNPYCIVKYVANDGVADSADEGVITINIASRPLPPRSESYRFFAPKLETMPFQIAARSVHDNNAQQIVHQYIQRMEVVGCTEAVPSTIKIGQTTIVCDGSITEASPISIIVADNSNDVEVGSGAEHTFTGSWTPTAGSQDGTKLTVRYVDTHTPDQLKSVNYEVSFLYRQVNSAPEIQYKGANSVAQDGSWGDWIVNFASFLLKDDQGPDGEDGAIPSIGYFARDADSADGLVHADIDFIWPTTANEEQRARAALSVNAGSSVTLRDNGAITISGVTMTALNEILSGLKVGIIGKSSIKFNLTVVVHDEGNRGTCDQTTTEICDKSAHALLVISASSTVSTTAIGLAAGAGGAALAAAAAAAIAWRALREPPTESYNPWEMDDAAEGTVMNPLFEASGKSGESPIFEAAGK